MPTSTLSGEAERPQVAGAVIEASMCLGAMRLLAMCLHRACLTGYRHRHADTPRDTKGHTSMKIAVIHDYADVFRTTRAYPRLQEHEVIIHTDAYTDPARVVAQVTGCDALLLTQQRVPLTRQIIERLSDLRCISQTGRNTNHLDVAACTEHGIVISAGGGGGGGSPYSTTAELT